MSNTPALAINAVTFLILTVFGYKMIQNAYPPPGWVAGPVDWFDLAPGRFILIAGILGFISCVFLIIVAAT